MADLSVHGGWAVVAAVLSALAALPGLRLAEPGEFTKRAFLNHKLDLTEAEAVADLIHAETSLQRVQALAQLGGDLKNLYDRWRDALIKICAYLEAHLDFPDEGLPVDLAQKTLPGLADLAREISAHLADGARGELIRDGARVVIIGAPNVGKSSLLNAVARREAAIVSEVPGTTRDVIDVHLDLGGLAVTLSDTAGLRAASNDVHGRIEQLGIDRARGRARTAQIKLALFDASVAPDPDITAMIDEQTLVVLNKIDLVSGQAPGATRWRGQTAWAISTLTGAGLQEFLAALTARLHNDLGQVNGEGIGLTRARHRDALTMCLAALERARDVSLEAPELLAEECRAAISALSRLTGRIDVEDLLEVIFRDFCIGK
jgi:tRNA modification GTPase